VPHGNTLRALVTWRWHFDEVFLKVNGWLEQANFARSSKFVFDFIERGAPKGDRAVRDLVKSNQRSACWRRLGSTTIARPENA
jgi:hypothetical protein